MNSPAFPDMLLPSAFKDWPESLCSKIRLLQQCSDYAEREIAIMRQCFAVGVMLKNVHSHHVQLAPC
jgi:hypothetical protein